MKLILAEEQALLEASALSLLDKEYGFTARKQSLSAPHGCSDRVWRLFSGMGWLALPLPEAEGGLGGGPLEIGLLMHALGRYLVIEPFHPCIVLAARLLADLGSPVQRKAWLPAVIQGHSRVALAHDEVSRASPWLPRATRAQRHSNGWVLHGQKHLAVGAPGAALLLVSASVELDACTVPNQQIFLVPPKTVGLTLRGCATADGMHAADITLDGVTLPADALLGTDQDVGAHFHRLHAESLVALCWEACGALTAAYEQTVAHTQRRIQFGQPLSRFQVVGHRLAEMAVQCLEARSACELASLRIARGDGDVLNLSSMVKNKVGRCAEYVAKEAVQLHGAMGVTDELSVASYFRKLLTFQLQSGTTAWHGHHLGRTLLASGAWRDSQTLPATMHRGPAASAEEAAA